MSLSEHNIVPGLQGPTTYKEYPSIPQMMSAKASQATGITGLALPVTDTVRSVASTVRYYTWDFWASYPLLRAFVYSFGLLTSIPVGIFLAFAAVTLSSCLVIAGIAITVIEGGILGFGLLCLSPFLFFSFWGALLGTGAFGLFYYGLRAATMGVSTAQNMTGLRDGTGVIGNTIGMAKNAAAMTADTIERVESKVIGAEGLPAPLTGRV
ncbi:hypothetical protein RI367_007742 [Sorochytrium milnesiophthora]